MKRAKIVATLGPASAKQDILEAMLQAGVNVFRVNFSHGSHGDHRKTIGLIRAALDRTGMSAAILADLQGPKLRVGEVEEGTVITKGEQLIFSNEPCVGNKDKVFMTYERFPKDVKAGERILLDDGKLLLDVVKTNKKNLVTAIVVQGGVLSSNKGVNLPNTRVSLPCLTEKDLVDLNLALELEVDWIGLSFVRSVKDVEQLRRLIKAANSHAGIVSKIEKPEAVADIDAIIAATDAVMVARGDLGVEVPMESVPLIQKMIIKKSILLAKPVIVATQMMESMMDSLTPSRAEVNDVANAVLDGADAVMLSGETSVGQYPVEVVQAIAKIIVSSESISEKVKGAKRPKLNDERLVNKTLCYHGVRVADQIDARAICAMTFSGYSAQLVSSHRPQAAIYAFTAKRSILNKLSLHWGLKGFFYDGMQSTDETFKEISQALKVGGLVDKGDFIVQLASMPIEARGTTNTLRVSEVK
ncbi:MAG: pyruvate kinase [Flavobacteriales bacterium]|jgi:pyruvate kinase|tara:strand:- start:100 stop:1515 length:1416 start_codon:yes stop_codon:yes gene_type:complete